MAFDLLKDEAFLKKTIDKKTGKSLFQLYIEQRSSEAKQKQKSAIKNPKNSRQIPDRIEQREMMRIILPYPPSVNHIYATAKSGKRVMTEDGKAFKENARKLLLTQKTFLMTGEIIFTMKVFRSRKVGDLSNRIKIVEDCLKNICYFDDEQITELHLFRFYDKNNPRIEIEIKQKSI